VVRQASVDNPVDVVCSFGADVGIGEDLEVVTRHVTLKDATYCIAECVKSNWRHSYDGIGAHPWG